MSVSRISAAAFLIASVPVLASVSYPGAVGCLNTPPRHAVATCRQWATRNARSVDALLDVGALLERKHDYAAAVAVYDQGLLLDPSNTRLERARFFADSDLAESRSTVRGTSPLASTSPNRQQAELDAIKCKRLSGAPAAVACRRALRAYPNDTLLRQRLAVAGQPLGKTARFASAPDSEHENAKQARLPSTSHAISAATMAQTPSAARAPNNERPSAPDAASHADSALLEKMTLLLALYQRGLISNSELTQRKRQLLESAFAQPPIDQRSNASFTSVPPASLDIGDFHALVIGNNDYPNLPSLRTGITDAQAVGTLLRDEYGFNVTTLVNAKRYDIIKELSRLRASLTNRDNVMIYYAGHGHLDEATGRGYWLPVDSEQDNPANWISTTDVTDTLKGMQAQHALVVADSCYSGTLNRAATGISVAPTTRHAVLERLASKRSRTVITSGGLEPVVDSGGNGHSAFAGAFLSVLRNNHGAIEGGRLFEQLRSKVVLAADQTPEHANIRKAGHEGGDFIFVRRP